MRLSTKNRRRIVIASVSLLVCGSLAWEARLLSRTHDFYAWMKSGYRGWSGGVHKSDPELGLRLVPGARGSEVFAIGPRVETRISLDGFRIPLDTDEDAARRAPLVLALGCSWTFGSACLAEESFPHLVAEGLGGTELNAGLCSAGSAQMLVLARRLIQEHEPAIVLVQESPWLIERSQSDFAPTYFGLLPTPSFLQTARGVELAAPVFATRVFDAPVGDFLATERGLLDFLKFHARVGLPVLVHDDLHEFWLAVAPGSSRSHASATEIEVLVYREIQQLCRAHGARMIVVSLDAGPLHETRRVSALIESLDVPIAYGTRRMRAALPVLNANAYIRAYQHVRGDPPKLVDDHPNPRAHRLIADAILEALRP